MVSERTALKKRDRASYLMEEREEEINKLINEINASLHEDYETEGEVVMHLDYYPDERIISAIKKRGRES